MLSSQQVSSFELKLILLRISVCTRRNGSLLEGQLRTYADMHNWEMCASEYLYNEDMPDLVDFAGVVTFVF